MCFLKIIGQLKGIVIRNDDFFRTNKQKNRHFLLQYPLSELDNLKLYKNVSYIYIEYSIVLYAIWQPMIRTAATGPNGEIILVLATVAPFIPAPFVVASSTWRGQFIISERASET